MDELYEAVTEAFSPTEIRITDERPCEVMWHGETRQALLHVTGCDRLTAKVEYEDGTIWDVPWRKVKMLDTLDRMDDVFGVEEDEEDE